MMRNQTVTRQPGHLSRLSRQNYRGRNLVHWTMPIAGRETGWLDQHTHMALREILLHSSIRYDLCVPLYCFMPDHVHFVTAGLEENSLHLNAIKFFRRHSVHALSGRQWQPQAYDRVLRTNESSRSTFPALAHYILNNPVRAGLVETAGDYPFSGCILAGYPDLTPCAPDFWQKFWPLYYRLCESTHQDG
jgi:putative transposase